MGFERRRLIKRTKWKCGDSFFTKYSSCSFDRAAHDPNNLLNPLHPSVRPVCFATIPLAETAMPDSRQPSLSPLQESLTSQGNDTTCAHPAIPTIDLSSPSQSTRTDVAAMSLPSMGVFSQDAKTSACIPIPLEEIGMASRMSQTSLGENGKCLVFEVVLQRREATMCPFCARSAKRRKLPAHARGCFAPS